MSTPESDPRRSGTTGRTPVRAGRIHGRERRVRHHHPSAPPAAPIAEAYYEAGGQIVCALPGQNRDGIPGRLPAGPGLQGLLLGSIAAAVGAILYYAIMRITGLNIGLVAVVVGLMVGGAVKAGSGQRGGRFYQLLALLLTYTSIAAMYLPVTVELMSDWFRKAAEADSSQRKETVRNQ